MPDEETRESAVQAAIGPALESIMGELFTNCEQPALTEWVLVATALDLADGETVIAGAGSANLLRSHRNGLLHEGLWSLWED